MLEGRTGKKNFRKYEMKTMERLQCFTVGIHTLQKRLEPNVKIMDLILEKRYFSFKTEFEINYTINTHN